VNTTTQGRIIGIRHRVKHTADNEARPTQLWFGYGSDQGLVELKAEQDELEFVRNGLESGDKVAMVLGGSGDSLAYALSRAGEEKGVRVFRIPAFLLKEMRGESDKDDDARLLADMLAAFPERFYEVRARDRALIEVVESFRARMDAMRARIACEQRLRASFIGKTFRSPDGFYPEGVLEDLFDVEKASDKILAALVAEEKGRNSDLTKALERLDVYTQIFADVEGCGMSVSAGIIAAVQDIRRFESPAKLKAFLGAHLVMDEDGEGFVFARRRRGRISNWNPDGRQALYLFADQMNRRPKSVWGLKLREYKVKFRRKHPEVVVVGGKKRYTDGHIHKMATWRTITKFVEWLYREWWALEGGVPAMSKVKKVA